MIRVNLLPHREEKRKARQKQLAIIFGIVTAIGLAAWGAGHLVIGRYVANQQDKNVFLKKEITLLDTQLEKIKQLQAQIDVQLQRKGEIERLQTDRAEAVKLFDQLVTRTPEGVMLKSVRQQGAKVTVVGYALSNKVVSDMLRQIEASDFLKDPDLQEIKATTLNNKRVSEFSIHFMIKRPEPEKEMGKKQPGNDANAKDKKA